MLTYRTFCNTDPPVITAIWRSCAGWPGLRQPVSPDLFEQLVFAKLYFDYRGLIIACEDGQPVGFGHAAFGPNEARSAISTELGVTCLVLARPDCAVAEVTSGLLEQCEGYLLRSGAKVLYGGPIAPSNPFYLGLYGGSDSPGVLENDLIAQQLYTSHHYQEVDKTVILGRDLCNFEAPIDRRQMEVRRRMIVQVTADLPSRDWWEACVLGEYDLTQFELVPRGGGPLVAHATFRSMEPGGSSGVARAAGLVDLHVEESFRRRGVAVFLLSEACRQFVREGLTSVEVQTLQQNLPALALFRKLGFRPTGQGSIFRKG
jgi:ribosomal protein S18 acetylase RimI-like enzyme